MSDALAKTSTKTTDAMAAKPDPNKQDASSLHALFGAEETLRAEVERAWLEWWDGETNPNSIDGGWMWREGYLAGRRAHESNSLTPCPIT